MKEETYSWLNLKMVPGLGNNLFHKLLKKFKTPQAVCESSIEELKQVDGISTNLAQKILLNNREDQIKKELLIVDRLGLSILTFNSDAYPVHLKSIYDPPPILFVKGSLIEEDRAAIAIVGTRNASRYGLLTTEKISRDLAEAGFTIISGLATGIDTAAHKAAIPNRTIAILGSGLSNIYPAHNKGLAEQITKNGAVISEFFPSEHPEAFKFPVRNRVISGMSIGTLIVEGKLRSGSLITARLAAEQGREVFAVPGNVNSILSRGPNNLIKQGAVLVESAKDIIEELAPGCTYIPNDGNVTTIRNAPTGQSGKVPVKINLSEDELKIYNALSKESMHIDEIAATTQLEPGRISSHLMNLELKDLITKGPGGLFEKTYTHEET